MISNNQIKWVKSLQDKKYRKIEQCFVIEGTKMVGELLLVQDKFPIIQLFALSNWLNIHANIIHKNNIPCCEINSILLKRLSNLKTPNEVIAVVKISNQIVSQQSNWKLVLDDIQDPGNMGTIVRIADWFSCYDIICSMESVDIYNPKVVQATMGSIFRVNIQYLDILDYLKNQKNKMPIYASVLNGKDIRTMEPTHTGGILLMGNESQGLKPAYIQLADYKISILKSGDADSLNVSVATGILLSHLT